MNPHEIDISQTLVSELIASQFPDWAHLPLAKVSSAGTDNAIYRLGDAMAVRLPRLGGAAETVAKEQQWLPRLAPQLPLSIPVPLAAGIPEGEFPYPWSVHRWLTGEDLAARTDVDLCDVASQLGEFIAALQRIDTAAAPVSPRATPIDARDDDVVRFTIRQLSEEGALDGDAAIAVWESALAAHLEPPAGVDPRRSISLQPARRAWSIGSSHRLRPTRPWRSSDRHASGLDPVDCSEP